MSDTIGNIGEYRVSLRGRRSVRSTFMFPLMISGSHPKALPTYDPIQKTKMPLVSRGAGGRKGCQKILVRLADLQSRNYLPSYSIGPGPREVPREVTSHLPGSHSLFDYGFLRGVLGAIGAECKEDMC